MKEHFDSDWVHKIKKGKKAYENIFCPVRACQTLILSSVIIKFHNISQHTTVGPLSMAASLTPEEDSTLSVAFLAYPLKLQNYHIL